MEWQVFVDMLPLLAKTNMIGYNFHKETHRRSSNASKKNPPLSPRSSIHVLVSTHPKKYQGRCTLMNMNGPVKISRSERLQTCQEIAARLHEVYGEKILAIGVYGSVSRGTDGPFSDIEMFCVLGGESSEPVEFSHEWSAGPWKAEVNVCSADVLLKTASTVEGKWPLTHGPFFSQLSLYDPKGFFSTLKKAAESPTKEDFRHAINEVLVGEMYEFIGKLRNVNLNGPHTYLPYLAMQFAEYGAMLIGLHNQKLFFDGLNGSTRVIGTAESSSRI